MGNLIYTAIASLDGYVADAQGNFDWAGPDEDVHAFVNDLVRPVGTYLYGRRMYDVMSAWETLESHEPVARDFAEIWRAADKIVYSTTLETPSTARTRIEPVFDPGAVQQLKRSAAGDIGIGGAHLAGQALAAGLVDELHLIAVPVLVGSGTHWLPDGTREALELVDERRFAGGAVHLHYRVA